VSNHPYTARETIKLLQELGIDYINYIPYYQGAQYEGAEIAITPGGRLLIPAGIKKVIDLKVKLIDVSTIIEILTNLNLPLDNTKNILTVRYTREMVNLNKCISELNGILKAVLNTSHDGILVVNGKGSVIFYNKRAKKLLQLNDANMAGKNISEIIEDIKLKEIIMDQIDRINEMLHYNVRKLMVNKMTLSQGKTISAKVFSFKDITEIQKLEHEIRKKTQKQRVHCKIYF